MLYRGRVNVIAAHHEHVIRASDEVVKALPIPSEDIAGIQPAVLEQSQGSFLGAIQITLHDTRVLDLQDTFALVGSPHQPELAVGQGITHRHGRGGSAIRVCAELHRSCFGQAVTDPHLGVFESVFHHDEKLFRDRARAHVDCRNGRIVEPG